MIKPVRKAIFPVGGLGTRFLPATKSMPKEMLTVVDKPIIQYAVEEAWRAGIEECIFVTGRGKSAIEDHFDYSYELEQTLLSRGKIEIYDTLKQMIPKAGQTVYVRQQEPMGLGHAVWCARNLIGDEPVAILLADDMILPAGQETCLEQMMQVYNNTGANVVASMHVAKEKVNLYGIIDPEEINGNIIKIKSFVEKPKPEEAPSQHAVIGRYILQPKIFHFLENQSKGIGGEIQLTDALDRMLAEQTFYGVSFAGERFDCGNRLGFLEANIAFSLKRPDMEERVKNLLQEYQLN